MNEPCENKLFPVIDGRAHVKLCGWEGNICLPCQQRIQAEANKLALATKAAERETYRTEEPQRRVDALQKSTTPRERYNFLVKHGWEFAQRERIGKFTRVTWWMPETLVGFFYSNSKRRVYQNQTSAILLQFMYEVHQEAKALCPQCGAEKERSTAPCPVCPQPRKRRNFLMY